VQRGGGKLAEHRAVRSVEHAQRAAGGDGSDDTGTDLPSAAHAEHLVEILGADDREHAFLALARHDLERLHPLFPAGDLGDVDVHAHPCPRGRLARRADEAGTTEILDPHDESRVQQCEARLDEALLLERIAHLHVGSLRRVLLAVSEAGRREHAHAADAVPARGGAQQHGQVPHALRLGQDEA
jgi:hypothetical protein